MPLVYVFLKKKINQIRKKKIFKANLLLILKKQEPANICKGPDSKRWRIASHVLGHDCSAPLLWREADTSNTQTAGRGWALTQVTYKNGGRPDLAWQP